MLHTRNKFTKSRIVATAVLVITTMGVGTVGSAIQASAVATNLGGALIGAVVQQAGHITDVTFDNPAGQAVGEGTGGSGFPASYGRTVTINFIGATKADGTPVPQDGASSAGYQAKFCGNFTSNSPTGNRAVTGADVSNADFVVGKCGPFVNATSDVSGIHVTIPLVVSPGQPAIVDTFVAGHAAVPAVVKGSLSAEVPATADVPPADVPATLFSAAVTKGSVHAATQLIPAVPPADVDAISAVADSGVHGQDQVEGLTCQPNNTVVPCLVIITNLSAQADFAMAFPAVNPSAVSVVGRVGLYDTATSSGVCNPNSLTAPPSSCPAARLTTNPAAPYPVIFGGQGFIPSANSPALIGVLGGNAAAAAGLAPGDNFTAVTLKVCNTPANDATCLAGPSSVSGPLGVSSTGATGGAIVISPAAGITTGNKFLQVSGQHLVYTGGPAGACPPGFSPASASLGICSITQTYYTSIKIMAATSSLAIANGVLTGSSLEPRSHLSMQIKDINGLNVGAPILTDADGTGDVSFAFAGNAFENGPGHDAVASVVITVTDAGFGAGLGSFTVTVAATNGAACYSLSGVCNVAEVITTSVLPGNIELFANDAVVDIAGGVDLSTIDIQDPDSWYPTSEPGAISQVLIGDMRGSNSGFVVTATASDLVGGAQASNLILASDVFVDDSIVCDVYADAGEGNDPTGDIAGGVGQVPADEPGASLLADGSQELCTVAPNADGQAAGMFTIDASLIVAGRPTTAADDFTGTLTITITGN